MVIANEDKSKVDKKPATKTAEVAGATIIVAAILAVLIPLCVFLTRLAAGWL